MTDPPVPGPSAPPGVQAALLARHPLGFLRRLRARHGDVFALRLANVGRLVVVADPAEARPLAEADPATAHAGEARRRVLPMAPPRSVFGGDGHVHQEARGRVAAAFAPEAQAGREPAMAAITREHVRTWPRGRPTRALAHVRELMDDLCVRELLGVRDPDRARGLARALNRALRTPGNPPGTLPGGDFRRLDVAARAVWERRRRPVADLLTREIEDRRRTRAQDDSALSLLARADPPLLPDQAVDEILVTLMAAQEPPAIALTWLLLRLGGAPDLAAAVADGDERTTDAVVRETLRLHSAALGSLRRLTVPREAAGHRLAAGTAVMVPLPLVQRDERVFRDPDAFVPGRWLDGDGDGGAYLPFGAGARRCQGEHVSHAYFRAVLPEILRAARVRPAWPRLETMVVRATTLVPHRSGLVVLG